MCEQVFESSQNFVNQMLNLETVIKKTNEAEETKAQGDCRTTTNFLLLWRVFVCTLVHQSSAVAIEGDSVCSVNT